MDFQFNIGFGDTVTLRNATEGYGALVFKTLEALRWACKSVFFTVALKVDDDSVVHIGRLWTWLFHELPKADPSAPPPERLYAGRVFHQSQVIRKNFTRDDLWHPDWFPSSFQKWAVDTAVFAERAYPPYCGGGGYLLGSAAVTSILHEYDHKFAPAAKVIPVEDAFVGVLARGAGISPKEVLTFQEPTRGSRQTREMFIDQILVHRVVEPLKAFRWLMLSSNCHAGPRVCDETRNRTRGLVSQAALPSSTDAPSAGGWNELPPRSKDWISGAIPKAGKKAFTGAPMGGESPAATRSTPPPRKKNKSRRHPQKVKKNSR